MDTRSVSSTRLARSVTTVRCSREATACSIAFSISGLKEVRGIDAAFTTFERLRRQRVERIVAQGARSSSSKAAGPIGRIVRDRMLPLVFRYVVTEKSMAWMHEHHIDWQRSIQADPRAA